MSSVSISLVVVGVAITAIMRLVTSELPKPATVKRASDHRPRARRAIVTSVLPERVSRALARGSGAIDGEPSTDVVVRLRRAPVGAVELAFPLRWWERMRSGATLLALLGVLGVTAAGVVGLVLVVVVITLRRAVGP